MHTLITKKNGFTLVEVLVAVVLLGIVISLGYNLFFYGIRSFTGATTQSLLQRNARLASTIIVREVRNATDFPDVSVNGVLTYSVGGGDETIELDNRRLSYPGQIETDDVFDSLSFTLNGTILEFTIEASQGDQSYDLTTAIYLHNL